MKKPWVIVLIVVAVLIIYGWFSYNRLVTTSENVDNQWAQVAVVLQRRFDLIPNLVESVKGVLGQEQKVFGDLAEARTRYAGAVSGSASVAERVAAANQVESTLARLLVIVENYPALRSVEAVTNLMVQLEGSENRISVERQRFNDGVRDFNLLVKRFPSSLIARWFGFAEKEYFQATAGAETAPKVNLTP